MQLVDGALACPGQPRLSASLIAKGGIPEGHRSKHPTFAALFDNRISGVSQAAFSRVLERVIIGKRGVATRGSRQ